MTRGRSLGMVAGSLVGAFFGRVWWSWAGAGLPGRFRGVLDAAGWLVLAAIAVLGLAVIRRVTARPPGDPPVRPGRGPVAGWIVGAVVAVEVALVVGGQQVLTRVLHHAEWIPVWTLLVVAVGTVAVAETFAGAGSWYTVPGFGGAAVLWTAALSGLAVAWSARSRPAV